MMRTTRRYVSAIALTAVGAMALSACGGTEAADDASGPVKIDVWGWNAETGKQVAKAYNEAQDEVEVNYVLAASNTATQTNFQNLMASGDKSVPCLVQGFAGLTSMVAKGWATDVSKYVKQYPDTWSDGAKASAEVNGANYGVPSGVDAQFVLVNQKALDKIDAEPPATWEDVLALAPKLKKEGIDALNLPGEDPSGFLNLAQQAGAEWFAMDGDRWKINLLDKKTLQAADFYQKLIDGDYVSNETYQDKPALYNYFDSGKLAILPLAWWSMTGYETNFSKSLGDWHAIMNPSFAANPDAGAPGRNTPSFVPKGCEHPDAAVKFSAWLATPKGIEAARVKKTGAIEFPAQIPDASKYVGDIVPKKLTDQDPGEVGKIVVDSQAAAIGKFEMGPNADAWFPELQDQWGKAVAGDQTLEQALRNVQDFITKDLDEKGISYTIG
ncbi:extracellular solute-binding protein [Streptomyces sp. SID5914]|nr:extracellular solute-binding protein [Streptomyces sp. SID5914]MZG12710.1 extracellular solute-binding protein [Streptomyces sp. SID5914]